MIAALKQFDASFPAEDTHKNFLLNKMMKAVADFAMPTSRVDITSEAVIRHAEAILELNERSTIFYGDIVSYFDAAISLYNTDPDDFAEKIEQMDNSIILEKIEFTKSKTIEIELINRPVFDSFLKFEKKSKTVKHHKVHSALAAIVEYKKMCSNHSHKAHEFISILNQFVTKPVFPNGQSVLSEGYINSLVESSASFLNSMH